MSVSDGPCNVLFTCVGRRVALVRCFQRALAQQSGGGLVVGVDGQRHAPALQVVDRATTVCRCDDPAYIPTLLDLCRRDNIRLLFPLIDTDLPILAAHREAFLGVGTTVVISDPDFIAIAMNKYATHNFFVENNIPSPAIFDIDGAACDTLQFPVFMKPADGSASEGIVRINDRDELLFFSKYVKKPILMEYCSGYEVTLDMLFDFDGVIRCIVPRRRIEVRAGEVSKAVIVDDDRVMEQAWKLAGCLRGVIGCINVQCFVQPDRSVKFIEINPRFGGGAPLSIAAGADFPGWILEMAAGRDPGDVKNSYRKNVVMLRYDDAFFLEGPSAETVVKNLN